MEILITDTVVQMSELNKLAEAWYGVLIKGVADCEKKILALGGDWHMDANNKLIAEGSDQKNLWGFNVYVNRSGDDAIEYISLINIRPEQGNLTMEIENQDIRDNIKSIVSKLIPDLKI